MPKCEQRQQQNNRDTRNEGTGDEGVEGIVVLRPGHPSTSNVQRPTFNFQVMWSVIRHRWPAVFFKHSAERRALWRGLPKLRMTFSNTEAAGGRVRVCFGNREVAV